MFEAVDGRDLKKFANGIDLGWNPFRVAIDPIDRLILVRDNASHLAVFSLSRPGTPPRMVADIVLPEDAGLGPLVIDPDLGLAITGTSPVQYKPPAIELVADGTVTASRRRSSTCSRWARPRRRPPPTASTRRTWPLYGRASSGVPDDQDSVAVRVEGLGPGGGVLPDRPEPFLPSSRVMTLHRPMGLPLDDPGRNFFVSERPILLIADERARTDYWKNIDETLRDKLTAEDEARARYALCRNCERDLDGDGAIDIPWSDVVDPTAPIELAAAGRVRVTLRHRGRARMDRRNAGRRPGSGRRGRLPAVDALTADRPRPRHRGPRRHAARGRARDRRPDPGRTDLVLPAPGMDVVLGRQYSSAGIRYGLFGWGWELAGLDRLRANPDGTVELHTSGGDRFVFGNSGGHPGANAKTLTAWGASGRAETPVDRRMVPAHAVRRLHGLLR